MNYYVEIFERATGKVEQRMGPQSERASETIARGARINLDRKNYDVRVVPE